MGIAWPRGMWIVVLSALVMVIPDAGLAAPPLRFRQVAGAGSHSCGLTQGGSVYCWGSNYLGQLGDGTVSDRDRPTPVAVGEGLQRGRVAAIAAGYTHTCALTVDGRLFCWGYNQSGRLGDGTRAQARFHPVLVRPGAGLHPGSVTAVALGTRHTCATTSTHLFCWGDNTFGQLGDGTTTTRPLPTRVRLPGDRASSFTAGTLHTCALAGPSLHCWGFNGSGQLGDGTTTRRPLPTPVGRGTAFARKRVRAVEAGVSHTCALADTGVSCWGSNLHGQLGDGTTVDSRVPADVRMPGGPRPADLGVLRVGDNHACVSSMSGRAYCWGDNTAGQLGNGGSGASTVPTPVAQIGGVTAGALRDLSAGAEHTCAINAEGTGSCWGSNGSGRLGIGMPAGASPVPRPVAGPTGP
jgi:alpha-tubulin suppressor-like RCC1 family protein